MLNRHERVSQENDEAATRTGHRRGFTLIELLVVVSIIALLIAILVPSLHGVRDAAKGVATKSQITSLSGGLDAYKQESALGGIYPPSKSDWDVTVDPASDEINDPFADSGTLTHTTGASLLLYALSGADGLGTPGFPDLDGDGKWSNDFDANGTSTPPGAYGKGQEGTPNEGEPLVPRYGPFADTDPLIKSIKSIGDLIENEVFLPPATPWGADYDHKVFTDNWGYPILYYKARRGARALVEVDSGGRTLPGIYDPNDNLAITGILSPSIREDGLQSLSGPKGSSLHPLGNVIGNVGPTMPVATLETDTYRNTFERYIVDLSVTGRPTPVNKDSFLLISPGHDGLYGTSDDVTNFERR